MPEINIKVRDKCAEGEGVIICNNSDYTVVWDLDGEWTPYDTKTMRVNLADGSYQDVVFSGDSAPLPVLTASGWVSVGLYAGDIHTSRAARLLALSSVLTSGGSPASPAEDVYAQIMAKLNELSTVSRRISPKPWRITWRNTRRPLRPCGWRAAISSSPAMGKPGKT